MNDASDAKEKRRLDEINYYESERKIKIIQSKLDMWNEANRTMQNALINVENYEFHLMDLVDPPNGTFGNNVIENFKSKQIEAKKNFIGFPIIINGVWSSYEFNVFPISDHYKKSYLNIKKQIGFNTKLDVFNNDKKIIYENLKINGGGPLSLFISDNDLLLLTNSFANVFWKDGYKMCETALYNLKLNAKKENSLKYIWPSGVIDLKLSPKNRYIISRYKPERVFLDFQPSNWSGVYSNNITGVYNWSKSYIDINNYIKKQIAINFEGSSYLKLIYAFEFIPNTDDSVIFITSGGYVYLADFPYTKNPVKIEGRMDLVGTDKIKENSRLNHLIKISDNLKYFFCCTMYSISGGKLNSNDLGYVIQLYDLENKKIICKLPLDFKMVYDVQFKENLLYIMGTDKNDVFINKTYNPNIIKQNMVKN